jgi:hypothetical protein
MVEFVGNQDYYAENVHSMCVDGDVLPLCIDGVRYASLPCSSGKTYALARKRAVYLATHGQIALIAQPTTDLLNQTAELLLTPDPKNNYPGWPRDRLKVFYVDAPDMGVHTSVAGTLAAFSQKCADEADYGHIVLCTHAALGYIEHISSQSKWQLLIDEAPQIARYTPHHKPHTHSIFTDHITLTPYNSIYSEIQIRDEELLEAKARNHDEDEIWEFIGDTTRPLFNRHWRGFANAEQYTKAMEGKSKRFEFHFVLEPTILEGWGSVFITSANFENTLAFKYWSRRGVNFVEDKEFSKLLRFPTHTNGSTITIHRCPYPDKPWSKKYAHTPVGEDGKTVMGNYWAAVTDVAGATDEAILYAINKTHDTTAYPLPDNAILLPSKPHGRNDFAHINIVVYSRSLNPPSTHFHFLKDVCGIEGDEVRRAIVQEDVYQNVMRSSARDPKNTTPKHWYLPPDTEDGQVSFLTKLFPGAKVEELKITLPESKEDKQTRKWGSDKERKASKRREIRRKAVEEKRHRILKEQYKLDRLAAQEPQDESPLDAILAVAPNSNYWHVYGTLYRNVGSKEVADYIQPQTNGEFIEWLRGWHERIIPDKKKAGLISPAIFDGVPKVDPKDGREKQRGKANILYMRGIWLDIEKTDLTPEAAADLFPHQQMAIMNTFSHTKEAPRFRVWIPTTGPITADAYEAVIFHIKHKLHEAGYRTDTSNGKETKSETSKSMKRSGLDWSKKSAASLFLLPSQAGADPSQSFFEVYTEGREPLNVTRWLENGRFELTAAENLELFPPPAVPPDHQNGPLTEAQLEITERMCAAAEAEFRNLSESKGHDGFYRLRNAYLYAGCNLSETKYRLQVMARSARSPQERAAEIPDLINTAYLYKRRSPLLFNTIEKKKRWVPDHEQSEPEIDPKLFKSMRRSELSFMRTAGLDNGNTDQPTQTNNQDLQKEAQQTKWPQPRIIMRTK